MCTVQRDPIKTSNRWKILEEEASDEEELPEVKIDTESQEEFPVLSRDGEKGEPKSAKAKRNMKGKKTKESLEPVPPPAPKFERIEKNGRPKFRMSHDYGCKDGCCGEEKMAGP